MTKQEAEKILESRMKPILGFALKRCRTPEDAEDLSQEIVLKVYRALLLRDDVPFDLYCRPIRQYGGALRQETKESFSELLDSFYTEKERFAHQQQRSQTLVKLVKNRRERAARKLAARLAMINELFAQQN